MTERGNTKHGPALDDKMQQETRGLTNAAQSPHVEEWRETEPVPDDTDSAEVREALDPSPGAGPDVDVDSEGEVPGSGGEPDAGTVP